MIVMAGGPLLRFESISTSIFRNQKEDGVPHFSRFSRSGPSHCRQRRISLHHNWMVRDVTAPEY